MIKEPDTRAKFEIAGSDVVISTPEAMAAKIRKELDYFAKVIKAAKIKAME